MPLTDMSRAELERYHPDVTEPSDFDAFWEATLAEARAAGGDVQLAPATTPISELTIEDLTFPGFGGDLIKAWVLRPRRQIGQPQQRLPTIVEYVGYNGGRGIPGERVLWALAGYVHVVMDTRGQGSGWGTGGETPDPHGSTPHSQGWMTQGILDQHEHYYRRVFTDAVRLVDAVRGLPFVDPERVAVAGASQGGGITIAAAALSDGIVAAMPDVAFLCDWKRGIEVAISGPYREVATYLSVHRDHYDAVMRTASYFDGVNFAKRITTPALFSVALMDDIVPPSTTFAAYNWLASTRKSIEVYPFNGHEGGQTFHWLKQAAFLNSLVG